MGRGGGKKNQEKRRRDEEEDEEEEMMDERRKKLSKFVDEFAVEASDDEDEEDYGDGNEDGFFVDDGEEEEEEGEIPEDYEEREVRHRPPRPPVVRRTYEDDEEVDVETMEKMVNERYSRAAAECEADFDDETTAVEQQSLLPSVYDPKLWMVKCLPGHEKEVAASLMQKSVDKGSEMRILSAIALDHLQNYIYVEAYKEADVKEACKGMRHIFSKNISMVPLKEMSNVLLVETKRVVNVSIGDWVRLKRSNYKGSLAKVVDIDHVALKVTVKVAPKMSAISLDDKLEGINSFYKTVALSSVTTGDLKPSMEEIENFREIGERDEELATLFNRKYQECFERGDTVMTLKGELKNVACKVEYVEGDFVHIKPNVKIPLKTITVRKTELVKHFEAGCQVKIVNGIHEGTTGMVIKVNGNKLIILSDATKDQASLTIT
ncbi:putative transcription elongation factor SPT5 homolog 2 [Silene latifolia]|uniref:putative transcription elongation factor SPT5 homolog 2 n=1 Tax=Silene latifolia TaxID=37657 RepID=UPI003D76E5D4